MAVEQFHTKQKMNDWQLMQLLAQLDQVQLHASDNMGS